LDSLWTVLDKLLVNIQLGVDIDNRNYILVLRALKKKLDGVHRRLEDNFRLRDVDRSPQSKSRIEVEILLKELVEINAQNLASVD